MINRKPTNVLTVMGVKHFYFWYRQQCTHDVFHAKPENVDTLAVDMNGVIHPCAQKIYGYGNDAVTRPSRGLLRRPVPVQDHTRVYQEICDKIDAYVREIRPRKRLLLCIDGIAGLAKMNQQRQRRFRAGQAHKDGIFDPNSITPGTAFMGGLSAYMRAHIHKKMNSDPEWQAIEVVFSDDLCVGEGEHKIMSFLRGNASKDETVVIHGLDADLMMLGMLLPCTRVYTMREPEYRVYTYVNLAEFSRFIVNKMRWTQPRKGSSDPLPMFSPRRAIHDFILLCFLVGNDFVPTVPTLTILDGAVSKIMSLYRENGKVYGHIIREPRRSPVSPNASGGVLPRLDFRIPALRGLLLSWAKEEAAGLEEKYNSDTRFFRDPMVEKNLSWDPNRSRFVLRFDDYRRDYYAAKFPSGTTREMISHEFFHGMLWVINYYRYGIPDWHWYFPFLYGPFLAELSQSISSFETRPFLPHEPVDPYLQLLVVLPPTSRDLLPPEFHSIMVSKESPLRAYFPETFRVDVHGKRKDWEGIVLLPPIDLDLFRRIYTERVRALGPVARNRAERVLLFEVFRFSRNTETGHVIRSRKRNPRV